MTAYPFVRSSVGPPQFSPTFDGTQYQVQCIWSLQGQRFYVSCYDLNGNLIFNLPMIESAPGQTIESLSYDPVSFLGVGVTTAPHGYAIGSTAALTISGALPTQYNGTFLVLATGPDTFTYPLPLPANPGPATAPGLIAYQINLLAGYFFTSTMVFVNGSFVVTP